MNKREDEPNYTKYDFTPKEQRQNRRKNLSGWWMALVIILIAVGIGGSIVLFQNAQSSSKANPNPISKELSKTKKAIGGQKTSSSLSTQDQNNAITNFEDKLNRANVKNNGISSNARLQLQEDIDSQSNINVKKQEQNMLDQTPNVVKTEPTQQTKQFSETHTFSSVQDAKDWANATKSQWLAAGFNNFTITSNGQGYYVLHFIK